MNCKHIESLSITGATWSIFLTDQVASELISQEMLMKMVRHHPTLRWLRSDLL